MRSRRCSARTSSPGDAWILNDPYRGGTHLPDITAVSPLFLGDRHGRLRGRPRAPRRRRRRGPGQHAGPLDAPRPGGRGDPPDPARAGLGDGRPAARRASSARCAARASARPTCARSWPPTGSPHGVWSELAERHGRGAAGRRDGGGARLRRAPHAARDRDDPRRHATAPPTCSRTTAGDGPRDLRVRCSVTVEGDAIEIDFAGTAPQSRRQPQLPAVGHEVRRRTSWCGC